MLRWKSKEEDEEEDEEDDDGFCLFGEEEEEDEDVFFQLIKLRIEPELDRGVGWLLLASWLLLLLAAREVSEGRGESEGGGG